VNVPSRAAGDTLGAAGAIAAQTSGPRARGELILICAVILAAGAVMVTWYPVNHDIAWLLHVAARWVGGARLYVDVVEVNPPLIIMLLTPVVAAADLLGVWEVSAFYFAVLALSALSLWIASRILLRITETGPASFLIIGLAAVYMFLPRIEFGQREHLMLLFTMPYYFSVAAHGTAPQPRREALLTGTLAGLGFALKPHFLLVLIACEVYLALSRRRWTIRRAEFAAIVAVGLAYAFVLVVFIPAYFEVARWASRVYGAFYPSSWRSIAAEPGVLLGGITLIATFLTKKWDGASLRHIFAIATAAFVSIVFIQNKNFDYHWLPVYGTSVIVWISLVIEFVRKVAAGTRWAALTAAVWPRRLLLVIAALPLIAISLAAGTASSAEAWSRLGWYPQILTLIEREDGARNWFALSANAQTAFPLTTYTDLEWSAPFHSLWPVIGLYDRTPPATLNFPYRAIEEMGTVERQMFDTTLHALFRARPTLILVDRTAPGGTLNGFDFLRYFAADEQFVQFMNSYAVIADLGPYRIFRRGGKRSIP
jgi:hypothetical protein